ncbi:unnamed protein product [Peniophora sp. CBMAI 1063]|nr:unnamed protein product [Peniophora sp. CBMAI 1063]
MVRFLREAEVQRGLRKIPRGAHIAAFRGKTTKDVLDKGLNNLNGPGAGKDVHLGFAERISDKLQNLYAIETVVKVAIYSANYIRLDEREMHQRWLDGGETLEMRTLVHVPKPRPEPGPEVIDIPSTPGASEDWRNLCYKKLQDVRERVCLTEDLVVPDDVLRPCIWAQAITQSRCTRPELTAN